MNIAQCTLYCTVYTSKYKKGPFQNGQCKSYSSDKWIGKSFTRKCCAVQRTFSMPLLHPYTVQYVGIKKTYREKVNIYCLKRCVGELYQESITWRII